MDDLMARTMVENLSIELIQLQENQCQRMTAVQMRLSKKH